METKYLEFKILSNVIENFKINIFLLKINIIDSNIRELCISKEFSSLSLKYFIPYFMICNKCKVSIIDFRESYIINIRDPFYIKLFRIIKLKHLSKI